MFHNNTYPYYENGRGIFLHFTGINEDPGQFEIVSDWDDPLVGDNVTFEADTTRPYGTNLFFDPIPFEMLKTFDTVPQIVATINDLPAVCHNITCGYTYLDPVGEVTAFTFTAETNELVLEG
jgi:hypothetical protein